MILLRMGSRMREKKLVVTNDYPIYPPDDWMNRRGRRRFTVVTMTFKLNDSATHARYPPSVGRCQTEWYPMEIMFHLQSNWTSGGAPEGV